MLDRVNAQGLAQLFPELLPYVAEADRFLAEVQRSRMPLLQQLKACRIGAIEVEPMICATGLNRELLADTRFLLSLNARDYFDDAPESLGQDLGLTFLCEPQASRCRCCFPIQSDDAGYYMIIWKFCKEFSRRWLALNDRDVIDRACQNQRQKIGTRHYLW